MEKSDKQEQSLMYVATKRGVEYIGEMSRVDASGDISLSRAHRVNLMSQLVPAPTPKGIALNAVKQVELLPIVISDVGRKSLTIPAEEILCAGAPDQQLKALYFKVEYKFTYTASPLFKG